MKSGQWKSLSMCAALLAVVAFMPLQQVKAHCGGCGSEKAHAKTAKAEKKSDYSSTKVSEKPGTIVEVASAAGSFNTLLAAAKAAGLAEALAGEGPLTVFAPTDEAFSKLPEGTVPALLNDLPKLRSILNYHVVPGKVMAADVVKVDAAKSLLGQQLPIDTTSGVNVAGANVIKADVKASNGVIHVVDRVMLPEADIVDVATEAGKFKTLLTAAKAAGLLDTLRGEGPLTVLAPTDEAFAALPKGTVEALVKDAPKLRSILKYHVIPGAVMSSTVVKLDDAKTVLGQKVSIEAKKNKVIINDAKVVKADITAANGVIHVINKVLLPEADILDVAKEANSFNTLLTAVKAAGLEDTLRSEGPFTVFAPTDAAFAKLPAGTIQSLLKDTGKLKSILTYHVVAGEHRAASLIGKDRVKTVNGEAFTIDTSDGVQINDANVVSTDIEAANGIIHVIDAVILPKQEVSQADSATENAGS